MSSLKIETICLDPESEVSWERVMDMSIEKLVFIDAYQPIFGPVSTLHPTLQRIWKETEDCKMFCGFFNANLVELGEKVQDLLQEVSVEMEFHVEECMPLFLLVRIKTVVQVIQGADAPKVKESFNVHIPAKSTENGEL